MLLFSLHAVNCKPGEVRPGQAPLRDRSDYDKADVHKRDSYRAVLLGDESGEMAGWHLFVPAFQRELFYLRRRQERFSTFSKHRAAYNRAL